jgi:FeS assembly protein SufD
LVTLLGINNEYVNSITQEKEEPPWLREMREQAFSKYSSLPPEVSPLYKKYSDVNRLQPENVYLADNDVTSEPSKDVRDRYNELEEGPRVLLSGCSTNRISVPDKISKQGLIISDLKDAVTKYEDLLKETLTTDRLDYEKEDKFLALETSAYRSGLFIYIPKNELIEEPIRIVNSLAEDGTSSIMRNIIVSDTGSKATIVQEIYSLSKQKRPNLQQACFELMQCHIKRAAHLEMVTFQAMSNDAVNFSNKKAFIDRDARMSWYIGLFGAQLSRCKIDSIMKGNGSSAEDVEIAFGVGRQSFDISSNLIHYGRNSRGRVLVKSVMKDNSKSLFKGMIKIGKEAKAAESYLAGHAILLDKGAKSDAIPGLEIETNEVKATHSASVAQLDESQIFYLMSRGLSREGAKREIVNGFLEPLSRKMGPAIRAWINYLIENKWSGKTLMLKTDEVMEQILEVEKSRYRETQDIFEKHYKYR